jgi:putative phosphoesterase
LRAKALKIAALSDVHGNLPALEAVLADCKNHGVEQIWYLGDFVGYIPYPNEVIERLRNENVVSIIGNYDLKVLSFARNAQQWKKTKLPEKYSAFEWNYKALSPANRRYLQALPKERRIKIAGVSVLLTHGSPADNEEGIGSVMPAGRLNELAKIARADVVVCGHTHRPFKKREGGVLFVNAGSVGRPEGDTRASYAILDFTYGRVTVRHYKVKYDTVKAPNFMLGVNPQDKPGGLPKNRVLTNNTNEKKLNAVLALAEKCNYEKQHTHQVEKLALQLFDQITALHHLGAKERSLLRFGAILHDIGWIEGGQGHHKTALRIIMESTTLPFDFRDKSIIALLARYHRKRLPIDNDVYYHELSREDKTIVRKLAAILRLADGLDCSHRNLVENIVCSLIANRLKLTCISKGPLDGEFSAANDKADLFRQVFDKKLIFRCKPRV